MTSRRKPRRKRNGRRRRMVRQDKQILTEFMAAKWEKGRGKRDTLRSNQKGLLAAFLPLKIYHPLSYARLRWRCEHLSCCRFSLSETGNPGLPLSRVCKTASGNTVRRRKPLREPREISLNGLVSYLPTFPILPTSSTSIFHERRSSTPSLFEHFATNDHLSTVTPSPSLFDLHRETISTLTGEIIHIAPR